MLVLCSLYGFGFRVDGLIFCLVIRKMQEKKKKTYFAENVIGVGILFFHLFFLGFGKWKSLVTLKFNDGLLFLNFLDSQTNDV